jgi:uncharacterized RDD family membrane protein YckC
MDERAPRRRLPLPARLLEAGARSAERTARATGIDRAIEDGIEAAMIRALESPATERALARALDSPALERSVERALDSPAVERAVIRVLDSELLDRAWERLLASEEAQQLVERIAQAPEVRSAITSQGIGLLEDIGGEVTKVSRRIDATLEAIYRRLRRRPPRTEPAPNAGLVSRAIAFAADVAILNGIFLATGALVSLAIGAIFGDGFATPAVAIGTAAWIALGSLYLVGFWSLSGQTPGMRFLGLQLRSEVGRRIGRRRALRRLAGTVLSILPLGLGFLRVLGDDERRSLGDRWAGTEMIYT